MRVHGSSLKLLATVLCTSQRGLGVMVPMCVAAGLGGCETDAVEESPRFAATDTFVAAPLSTIGAVDGAPELFGRIVGVAADGDRTVYVADGIGDLVRAYAPDGRYLGTVGREGDGPGEFRYLRGIGVASSGELTVRGHFRVSLFVPRAGRPWADSLVGTVPVAGHQAPSGIRGRYDGARYLAPSHVWANFERGRAYYLAFDADGPTGDTIWVPPFPDPGSHGRANYMITEDAGRNVGGINRAPFEPSASWDVTPEGRVAMAEGGPYRIVEVGPSGDTLGVLARRTRPRPVPASESRDSVRAFRERIDSEPVPLDRVRGMSEMARSGVLPDVLPEVIGVAHDEDGNLWVRRWPRADRFETLYDLYDPERTLLGTVAVPAALLPDPVPWLSRKLIVGVTRDEATSVDRVRVFRPG